MMRYEKHLYAPFTNGLTHASRQIDEDAHCTHHDLRPDRPSRLATNRVA